MVTTPIWYGGVGMGKRRYVGLPEEIVKRIEKVKALQGYDSVADFVKDACRRRLEEISQFKDPLEA
jgi:metal-responsive CopG/Arc/MetJ family transcriptional regulator